MLNALFLPKNPFLTQISKCSTPTHLHHPDLHLAQFFSLESLKISSAHAKTSLGLKMEKFLPTIRQCKWRRWCYPYGGKHCHRSGIENKPFSLSPDHTLFQGARIIILARKFTCALVMQTFACGYENTTSRSRPTPWNKGSGGNC